MEGKKMFKKFLHDETTIIGLKSLGLSAPKNTTTPQKQTNQTLNLFSTNHANLNTQKQEPKTLEELFGRGLKLNLNK